MNHSFFTIKSSKAKGGVEQMQSALERRQEILEVLSDRRRDTVDNLFHRYVRESKIVIRRKDKNHGIVRQF